MKRILVTGANGYIGSHLVNKLNNYNYFKVIATDIHNDNINRKVNFIPCNILEKCRDHDLFDKLGCPEICIHLAWQDGFNHNEQSHIDFLPLHYHFIKNLVDCGCSHIAVAGSFREYGNANGKISEDYPTIPTSNYTWAKISFKSLLDLYFKNKDICFQWMRFFTPFGDDYQNNSILSKILKWEKEGKKLFAFTDGNEKYDYIHIQELVDQIIAIVSQTNIAGPINCCSGVPISLKDFVNNFIEKNGLKIKPDYGKFARRDYDPNIIYGDKTKILKILNITKES